MTTLTTPGGNPASAMISATSRPAVTGASSDGLSTTVLPNATGLTTVLQARTCAPFQGEIPATTPSGLRSASANVPGMSERMTSPTGRYPQLAACRSSRVAVSTWKPANAPAQPVSVASSAVISSRRRSTMSAARRNMACLPAGGSSAQPGNAAAAASTA